ncbi:MAG: hypothetical protein FLDDKLPJ_00929 [Phycisphaerae bacterium]|nr:hypothetical protein [Phycisphaerae bacterium]
MRRLAALLTLLCVAWPVWAAVLFEESFDSAENPQGDVIACCPHSAQIGSPGRAYDGNGAIRLTYIEGDPEFRSGHRAQYKPYLGVPLPGKEHKYWFAMYLPPDWQAEPGQWTTLVTWYSSVEGRRPPLHFQTSGEWMHMSGYLGESQIVYFSQHLNAVRGRWVRYYVELNPNPRGVLRVQQDGHWVINKIAYAVSPDYIDSPAFRVGIYQSDDSNASHSIYFDALRIEGPAPTGSLGAEGQAP